MTVAMLLGVLAAYLIVALYVQIKAFLLYAEHEREEERLARVSKALAHLERNESDESMAWAGDRALKARALLTQMHPLPRFQLSLGSFLLLKNLSRLRAHRRRLQILEAVEELLAAARGGQATAGGSLLEARPRNLRLWWRRAARSRLLSLLGQIALLAFLVSFCSFAIFSRPVLVHLLRALDAFGDAVAHYFKFVGALLSSGPGQSSVWGGQAITRLVMQAFPRSLLLIFLSLSIAVALGLPLGVASGRSRGALFSFLSSIVTLLGVVMPSFLLGLLVIVLLVRGVYVRFGVQLVSMDITVNPLDPRRILPLAFVLGARPASYIARIVAASVTEAYEQAYIYTARGKGLSERAVTWRHIFPNVFRPFISALLASLRLSLSSMVVAEWLFNWPGLGQSLLLAMRKGEAQTVSVLLLLLALLLFAGDKLAHVAVLKVDPTSSGVEMPR